MSGANPSAHAAMTLVYLAIAFACGILTGHVLRSEGVLACSTPGFIWPLAAALPGVALVLLRRDLRLRLMAAVLLFVALGAWRYNAQPFEACLYPGDLAHWQTEEGVWATVEGEVVGYPRLRDAGMSYELAADTVTIEGQARAVTGRAWVEAARYPAYSYGDRLRVSGLLLTPPSSNDFDYRSYLAERGIRSLMRRPRIEQVDAGGGSLFWRGLHAFRTRGGLALNRILPEPAASLANGMVLGIEGGIPKKVNEDFQATGASHLIVISGSNIAFLAGALIAALGMVLPKRRAALAAAPLILLYVLLVGADPPALRAGVMGLLGLGAVFFGRRGTAYVSLCAAGLVMLALNPLTMWDIGFRLSFLTSLGLILLTGPLHRATLAALRTRLPDQRARQVTRVLDGTLIVTVAAQAAALPLIAVYFGRLSPVSLLANALVLPAQPPILAGGIAALLGGLAWQPLGQAVGTVPWLFLTYTAAVVHRMAGLPFASVDVGRVGPLFVILWYGALIAALSAPKLRKLLRGRPEVSQAGAWTALLAAPVCFLLLVWHAQPDGKLHLVFVPAADGEAALIVAPDGRTAWVWDGRGDGPALVDATLAAWHGRPDVVLSNCATNPWAEGRCLDPAALDEGATVALTADVRLQRLAGGEPALRVSYGAFRALLPSTLTADAQEGLDASELTVLKAPGPGTGAWPTVKLLQGARPQSVLWPLETTYPPEVSEYLERNAATARVEADAAVEVVTDGKRVWVVRHSAVGPR